MAEAGLGEPVTLALVFLAAALEKLIPLMPSYGLLVGLGARLVSTGRDLALLTVLCAGGSTLGSAVWYQAGAWIGPARARGMVLRHGWVIRLSPRRFVWLSHLLGREPFRAGLLIQLVPILRFIAALPAGMLGLPRHRFFAGTALGAIAWSVLFLSVGEAARATGSPVQAGFAACVALALGELGLAAIIAGHCRRRGSRRPR